MAENFVHEHGHLSRNDDGTWEGVLCFFPEGERLVRALGKILTGVGVILGAWMIFPLLAIAALVVGGPIAIWLLVRIVKANAPATFRIADGMLEIQSHDGSGTRRIPIEDIEGIRLESLGVTDWEGAGHAFAVLGKPSEEHFARNVLVKPDDAPKLVRALHDALGIEAPATLRLSRSEDGGVDSAERESATVVPGGSGDAAAEPPHDGFGRLRQIYERVDNVWWGLVGLASFLGGCWWLKDGMVDGGWDGHTILVCLLLMLGAPVVIFFMIRGKGDDLGPVEAAKSGPFTGPSAWLITGTLLLVGGGLLFFSLKILGGDRAVMSIALSLLVFGAIAFHHLLFCSSRTTKRIAVKVGSGWYHGPDDLRFSFVAMTLGGVILFVTVVAPFIGNLRARNWVSVPCQIVTSSVRFNPEHGFIEGESKPHELILG